MSHYSVHRRTFMAQSDQMHKLSYLLISAVFLFSNINCNKMDHKISNPKNHKHTNKLIDESSPYLLQHAHNPVNWYPWGEEALNKAKAEDKLLIISVGYAACHWCHVMEHESFEDSLVAKIMNENFVCIKVDREERPDIDNVYMTACQLVSNRSCGWPLNAFALPDGRPVWAGTYFPKDQWTNILQQFTKMHDTDKAKLEETATQISEGMTAYDQVTINTGEVKYSPEILDIIGDDFIANIDFKKGGSKGSPKFPKPNIYEFLLKYNHQTGNQKSLEAVTTTLNNMALGGIYDQIGGGFARYSVDDKWLVPHFEKMLYDNGQLISLYAHAYQKTKNPLYEKTIRETIAFVERELMSSESGFYSSLDADSEGEEGKFYVWQKSEIDSIIGNETHANVFNEYFDVSEKGNWEHTNILNVVIEPAEIMKKYKIDESQFKMIIDESSKKLMKHRDTRIRPGTDDKILTSWNGLMLSGLIDAYNALGDKKFLDRALANANFIINNQKHADNRLNRNFKNGKSSINAFLDDYALTINAFIKLYQATFDEKWLYHADDLASYAIAHFYNSENGLFNYTSDIDPPLVANKNEVSDKAIPSSNSSMARNLKYLGLYFDKTDFKDKSEQMLKNVINQITGSKQPNFYSNWCQLYLDNVKAPYEVAIVGPEAEKLRKQLAKSYTGNALLLGGEGEGTLELLKEKLQEGETMIYVCQNKVCKFPVKEVEKALALMD